jgi:2'-5' RNA ligase
MSAKFFIAIIMPPDVLQAAEAIKNELRERYGLKGALRSPAHITLHRPFQWQESKQQQLVHALSEFNGFKPFDITLNGFAFFPPRVVYIDVMPCPQLEELHSQLTKHARKQLQLLNEAEDMRGFHPHVTVAFRDVRKRIYPLLEEEFRSRSFRSTFTCNGVSLLKLRDRWEEEAFFPFSAAGRTKLDRNGSG